MCFRLFTGATSIDWSTALHAKRTTGNSVFHVCLSHSWRWVTSTATATMADHWTEDKLDVLVNIFGARPRASRTVTWNAMLTKRWSELNWCGSVFIATSPAACDLTRQDARTWMTDNLHREKSWRETRARVFREFDSGLCKFAITGFSSVPQCELYCCKWLHVSDQAAAPGIFGSGLALKRCG